MGIRENSLQGDQLIAFLRKEIERLSLIEYQAGILDDYKNLTNELFISLCRIIKLTNLEGDTGIIWKATNSATPDYFFLGIGISREKQINRMLPILRWEQCYFAKELPSAPPCVNHEFPKIIEILQEL